MLLNLAEYCHARRLDEIASVSLGETDRVRSDDDDDHDDVDDDLVGMIFFVSYSFFCSSFLCLLLSLLYTVKQLLRRYNFVCHPIWNDLIFVPLYQPVIPCHEIPPTHPFLLPPAIEKCGFYTQNPVNCRFSPVFRP